MSPRSNRVTNRKSAASLDYDPITKDSQWRGSEDDFGVAVAIAMLPRRAILRRSLVRTINRYSLYSRSMRFAFTSNLLSE